MTKKIYKFVIHFAAVYGQIEYDAEQKSFRVQLDHDGYRQAVEKYLTQMHEIQVADGDDLRTFHARKIVPVESLDDFKLALTRLWQHTGVYVDWSRPTV